MRRTTLLCGLILLGLLIAPGAALARDFRLSVGYLPLYAETKDGGILIDIIKAMDEEYRDGRFLVEVYPMERSIDNVAQGKADLHFPTIGARVWAPEDGVYEKLLQQRGLRRSTCSLTKTHFALYRNSAHPELDVARLEEYRIETDEGHQRLFETPMQGTTCLSCSVKKLAAGRIDGLVFASREIDHMIREGGVTNVVRQDFKVFGSKFILPNSGEGAATDAVLCDVIGQMVRNGRLADAARRYSEYFEREYGAPYLPGVEDLRP
jgi:polar amino acid transport system substrate-binding protein